MSLVNSDNLREIRTLLGLTSHDVAELVGVSAQFIRMCETGSRKLPGQRAKEIEHALNIDADKLTRISELGALIRNKCK
ncbi:hypothetical protein A3844_25025 [Paenibacillus helianthi]|uniref:HTH cro/C1-type domain-containing protein n=1 Tax=Paenibacillus helianthi TaxID=1349432 RepID=A0ABX3EGU4_9BACL|nr:helix-turn-helix transcriptional regulator [Paenibacillus helianthi]OKP81851.1 hypothetical protein A3844_25025 [Paenibacillus helianthi]